MQVVLKQGKWEQAGSFWLLLYRRYCTAACPLSCATVRSRCTGMPRKAEPVTCQAEVDLQRYLRACCVI